MAIRALYTHQITFRPRPDNGAGLLLLLPAACLLLQPLKPASAAADRAALPPSARLHPFSALAREPHILRPGAPASPPPRAPTRGRALPRRVDIALLAPRAPPRPPTRPSAPDCHGCPSTHRLAPGPYRLLGAPRQPAPGPRRLASALSVCCRLRAPRAPLAGSGARRVRRSSGLPLPPPARRPGGYRRVRLAWPASPVPAAPPPVSGCPGPGSARRRLPRARGRLLRSRCAGCGAPMPPRAGSATRVRLHPTSLPCRPLRRLRLPAASRSIAGSCAGRPRRARLLPQPACHQLASRTRCGSPAGSRPNRLFEKREGAGWKEFPG
nr:translation initiation factor IF-2-like [Aegilops tauschii subsp. strangulata]